MMVSSSSLGVVGWGFAVAVGRRRNGGGTDISSPGGKRLVIEGLGRPVIVVR